VDSNSKLAKKEWMELIAVTSTESVERVLPQRLITRSGTRRHVLLLLISWPSLFCIEYI